MDAAAKVSVEEYLASDYEPDMDMVYGELIERKIGEKSHGKVQMEVTLALRNAGFFAAFENRLQISPSRFRIPDVCAYVAEPAEEIFRTPPFLCVEVLSPEDRIRRIEQRIEDYFALGVPTVWTTDPWSREAWIYTPGHRVDVRDGILRTAAPPVEVPLRALFK